MESLLRRLLQRPSRREQLDQRNRHWRANLKSVGAPVRVREPVSIYPLEKISLGSNVVIHENAYFQGYGGISIGDNVAISLGCTIITSGHVYDGPGWDALPWSEANVEAPVTIEDNVWIGFNVTLLPGVTVHEGAVVGAGSVVTNDIPRCAVAGGSPARVIKYRDVETYEALKAARAFRVIPTDIDQEHLVTR